MLRSVSGASLRLLIVVQSSRTLSRVALAMPTIEAAAPTSAIAKVVSRESEKDKYRDLPTTGAFRRRSRSSQNELIHASAISSLLQQGGDPSHRQAR